MSNIKKGYSYFILYSAGGLAESTIIDILLEHNKLFFQVSNMQFKKWYKMLLAILYDMNIVNYSQIKLESCSNNLN